MVRRDWAANIRGRPCPRLAARTEILQTAKVSELRVFWKLTIYPRE